MRHRFRHLTLGLLLVGLACADAPTTPSLRPFDAILKHTELEDFIQAAIDRYLPRGFESAVEARWATVKQKKNAGDLAGSIQQLNTLSLWIDKKTSDITIPTSETVTKGQAAALIILNMARWVYEGAEADPQAVPTGDVAVEVVPAGAPLQMVVPSQHASVVWDAGATQEDRVVVMLEDPGTYPGQCEGPLPTTYCQYPLFYKVESYPHLRLQTPGRMAVCLLTTGDRRPIEYPQDEPGAGEHGPVGERVRLAHQAPPNEADRTPGGVIKGNIEVLPLATSQSGLADCDAPSTLGMSPVEKAMHLAMRYVGKAISPKNAYAYDQGPEHDFSFFSNFNAVDTASAPDIAVDNAVFNPGTLGASPTPRSLSYSISNTSRRSNGGATATARNVFARAYISSNNTLEPGTDFLLGTSNFGVLPPNGTPQPVTHSGFELPIEGPVYLIVTAEQIDGPTETALGNNMVVLDLNANQVGDGLVGVWNGTLAPPGAPAGTGQPASFVITSQDGGQCTGEFRVAQTAATAAYNATRTLTTCDVEGNSVFAEINPWVALNNAVRSTFNMTRDGDSMVGTAARWFPQLEGPPVMESNPWTLTLTRGVIPIVTVPPPPVINAVAGVRMQNSTAETPTGNWY